jgi:hypothetical protein
VPPVTRHSCASYLASYVARAKYVSVTHIKHTLFHLLRWIHAQVDLLDEQTIEKNGSASDNLLPEIIQTACYILCFRGLELCGSEAGYSFVRSLGWQRILTCSIQPFRHPVFQATVASEFINFAESLMLMPEDCMEELLQSINSNSNKSHVNLERSVIEDSSTTRALFFPFDPYLLRRSFKFIGPIYLYWKHADPMWSGNSEAFHAVQSFMLAYNEQDDDGESSSVNGDENVSMPGSYTRSSISSTSYIGSSNTSSGEDMNAYFRERSLSFSSSSNVVEPMEEELKPVLKLYHDDEEFGF